MQYCMQLEVFFPSEIIAQMETTKQKWRKVREIIYVHRSKDCRQILTRDVENIQQVLKMVTVIGQFTSDSRVGSRNQCTPTD